MENILTTQEKDELLKGKRYKMINASIKESREKGEEISFEMEIDLHYAWMETLKSVRKDFGIGDNK